MIAPSYQSAGFVYTSFLSWQDEGSTIGSNVYMCLLALLFPCYCLSGVQQALAACCRCCCLSHTCCILCHAGSLCCCAGYDSCSHMAEETTSAGKSVPLALLTAVGASIVMGYLHILTLLFSIQVSAHALAACSCGTHCTMPTASQVLSASNKAPARQPRAAAGPCKPGFRPCRGQHSGSCLPAGVRGSLQLHNGRHALSALQPGGHALVRLLQLPVFVTCSTAVLTPDTCVQLPVCLRHGKFKVRLAL